MIITKKDNPSNTALPGLIVLWAGPFPSYFDLFLASCAMNPGYTWLIFSDQPAPAGAPDNVRFLPITADEVNQRVRDHLGVESDITKPYKYCDLRPMYGLLFADHLTEFTHWGHCDIDVIWGSLGTFLTRDIFEKYIRIQQRGHLSIYRNSEQGNNLFRLEAPGVPTWRQVLANPVKNFVFDEWQGINKILDYHQIPSYHGIPVADINPTRSRFRVNPKYQQPVQAFCWHDGRLIQEYWDESRRQAGTFEFSYIHLQKRSLLHKHFDQLPPLGFYITPHGFFARQTNTPDLSTIKSMNRRRLRQRIFVIKWRSKNLWRKVRRVFGADI